ncbi:polysaccharide biosynthesis tyrosine autokinase [Reichenbachiella agarivorans]|uniref:non-specific protein-tyrosine kinase n=1 Tax=Reichenbachiella agarivorans TaxID=2979464 RepID=A0ABY6CSY8_9BACT|nr:tyrosine-protein kinase family protein [Reichenbachiella agarivorans]UXP33641.1 polysaccharide biosynthesis tyrosine autokinase [Reichenbachiella agarivorans]
MNFKTQHIDSEQVNLNQQDSHEDPLNNIDFDKLKQVFVKNLFWIIMILFVANAATFLYIRYTKPVYSSESILKLDIKSEAGILGIQSPMEQDIKGVSGEIEILKSRLFASKVVDAVGMDVSYFHPGRSHLYDERYGNSPFRVEYKILNPSILDQRINLEILNDRLFVIHAENFLSKASNTHVFGEKIVNDYFEMTIYKTNYFADQKDLVDFYFVLNSQDALIDYFQNNILVEPINLNANTIKIGLSDYNKFKAKSLLQAIDTIYLLYTKAAKNQAVEQKIQFLETQMFKTQKDLEQYEDYFEKFTIKNRTTDLTQDLNYTIQLLNELDSQRFNLRNQISSVELAIKQLQEDTPITLHDIPKLSQELILEYNALRDERALKLSNYNENTQIIQQLTNRVELAKKNALSSLGSLKENLLSAQKELTSKRTILESNFAELPSMGTSYNKNRRLYSLQEEFYFSLIQSKIELEIARAGTVTDFVVLSPASTPTEPIKPQKILVYGAGFVAGLVICFFFIAISYLIDDKITNIKELERLLMAPVLGIVPRYSVQKLQTTRLVVNTNPKSSISEALRSIRTNMEFMSSGNGRKVISITSTVSGEGKTFITVNLAAIFAYSGLKVVVVDLDMRRPKVHLAFSSEQNHRGVSTLLINRNTLDECLNESELANLYYISAGPTPPNPSELILSDRFNQFLEELKSKFDIVILDTPPVGLVTDGILVMKKSDLPVYVVRADYSKKVYLKAIHSLIKNNKFTNLSVIFNSTSSSGTYGYGYGTGSGSGYYEEDQKTNSSSRFKSIFQRKS